MLRGVSKRIIEINDTGSDFFEKALFIVKDGNDLGPSRLKEEAKRVVTSYFTDFETPHQGYLRYSENKKKKRKARLKATVILGSVLFLIGVAIALSLLLGT